MSLSREEALTYLTEILGISLDMVVGFIDLTSSSNRQSSLLDLTLTEKEKRAKLLQSIVTNYLAVEPFQSISLMSVDPDKRKRPEWEDIKESSFRKQGGICYSLNSFMFVLLRSLGFEASLAHATVVCGVSCPGNHIVVLIHSLMKEDDLHLVDVGVGFPIFRAVPLDFAEESPVYVDSYHTYKFARRSRNKIALVQKPVKSLLIDESFNWDILQGADLDLRDKDILLKLVQMYQAQSPGTTTCGPACLQGNSSDKQNMSENDSGWREFFFFDPTEKYTTLEEFQPCFDLCYGDVTKLSMHSSPRALSWPDGRLLAVLHSKLTLEKDMGELLKFDITDIPIIQKKNEMQDSTAKIGTGGESRDEIKTIDNDKLVTSAESSHENRCNDGDVRDKNQSADVQVDWMLIQVYQRFYPQFSREMVESAIQNWKLSGTAVKLPGYLS